MANNISGVWVLDMVASSADEFDNFLAGRAALRFVFFLL